MGNAKKSGYGEWSLATIYNILRDPTYYQGYIEYYTRSREYESARVPIPPLVTKETWEAAQRILQEGKRLSPRNSKYNFLLRGRLFCTCGAVLHSDQTATDGKIYKRYICGRVTGPRSYAIRECNADVKSYRADALDAAVWAWIMEIVEKPQLLRAYLKDAQQNVEAYNAPLLERIHQIEEQRKRQENKLNLLLTMYEGVDLKSPANREVRALFDRIRDETQTLFTELHEEEDQLRAKLITYAPNPRFLDNWENYANRRREKGTHLSFEEKCDDIKSLNLTGQLGLYEGRKVLWVYLYDTYADRIALDGDSFQNSCDFYLGATTVS